MSTPLLKAIDVAHQIGKSLDFVKAHSRFNNPKLPLLRASQVLGRYRYEQADVDKFIADNTKSKS